MRNLLLTIVLSFSLGAYAQDARVQVVHNCADDMAAVVDVYINGLLAGPDVPFRTASPFADVPTGVPVNVAIAPGDSTSVLDAFYQETFNLSSGETYIIVANGIISPTGYNPSPPFSLEVFDMGREAAAIPTNVDVLVHHGSTDAPTVDAVETGQELGTVVDDISYPEFDGYLEFPSADYIIEIRDETGTNTIATYEAPLQSLGLEGLAAMVVASGFFDPSQNSHGPAFGLFAVLPIGGPLIPLPEVPLSVDEFNSNSISLHPNPTTNVLNISSENLNITSFQIIDINGRIVQSGALAGEQVIDATELSSGLYLIRFETDEGRSLVKKFTRQ